jgi:mono/diheme cytochrome c family protein
MIIIGALFGLGACAGAAPVRGPSGDEIGNPSLGLAYARDVCAACHAVGHGDLRSPNPNAPPFQQVADTPGMTRLALNAWLRSAHPSMPNFVVEDEQIDNLHAYLSSIAAR